MANTTRFTLDADAAKAVQEFLKLRDAEKKTDRGMEELSASAKKAERDVVSGAKAMVREYELAEKQISRALPLPRTLGGSFVARGRNVAELNLAALPSSMLRNPAATVPLAATGYSTHLERRAALNSSAMSDLIARGERARQESVQRHQLEFEQMARNVELKAAKSQQNRELLVGGLGSVAGPVGIAATAAAIGEVTQKWMANLDDAGNALVDFEQQIRPLLSLGGNMRASDTVRQQVLDISAGMGMSTADASSAMYMLQSNASNLGPKMQDQILRAGMGLNQVIGGQLQPELVAITKSMETFGDKMGMDPRIASAKLMYATTNAAITPDEMATLLPDVLPAAKLAGKSYDEVLGSTITATSVLGSSDKTFTGLRNFFLHLPKAIEEGLVPAGSLADQLKVLQKWEAPQLEAFFGEKTVSIVAGLADHTKELAENINHLRDATAGDVSARASQRLLSGPASTADFLNTLEQAHKNVPTTRALDRPDLAKEDVIAKAYDVGFDTNESTVLKILTPEWSKNLRKAQAVSYAQQMINYRDPQWFLGKDQLQSGLMKGIASLRATGKVAEADKRMLEYGALTDTYWVDEYGNKRYTSETEANDFAKHNSDLHGHFTLSNELIYLKLKDRFKTKGDTYLQGLGEAMLAIERAAKASGDAANRQHAAADAQQGPRAINVPGAIH